MMESVGLPSNHLAKCRVALFECQDGVKGWKLICGTGELHMRPLGSAAVLFQFYDLPSRRVILEHTMHKANGFSDPTSRFFVIHSENGRFHGFGFMDKKEACEMRHQIEKAVKPYSLKSKTLSRDAATHDFDNEPMSCPYGSSLDKNLESLTADTTHPPSSVLTESTSSRWRKHKSHGWQKLLKRFQTILQLFEFGNDKVQRDSMHEKQRGHQSWLDEIQPCPDYFAVSLRLNEGLDAQRDHHHTAAEGTFLPGGRHILQPPPRPPAEYLDSPDTAEMISTATTSTLRRRPTNRQMHRRSVSG